MDNAKMSKDKFNIIFFMLLIILLLFSLTVAFMTKRSFNVSNIKEIDFLSSDESLRNIEIQYAWGMNGEGDDLCNDLRDNADKYIDQADGASSILIVHPAGYIRQFKGSFSQEVTVIGVIRAESDLLQPQQNIQIYQYGGFEVNNNKIYFTKTCNIMDPSSTYIVFLENSPLNEYNTASDYYLTDTIVSCINLDSMSNQLQYKQNYNFVDYIGTNHFSTSENIATSIMKLEDAVLLKYDKEIQRIMDNKYE